MKPVIICFITYYLPGYRLGGPVRSIANLVNHLGDEFDIRIVTRDRDAFDSSSYKGVTVDRWTRVGKASVFYASNKTLTLPGIAKFLRKTHHDILYLNSFFAFRFTTLPLLARRLGLAPVTPCVIAPRGEFSLGALALKTQKKRLYLKVANTIKLYSHLVWQASSELERADIQRELGAVASTIQVASDLPPAEMASRHYASLRDLQWDELPLRLIFLSRIHPMKNLDFVLKVLSCIKSNVQLCIYGPLVDRDYWARCQSLIASLPAGIVVDYMGEVHPTQVLDVFLTSDLFVLPTRGENFGHVVLESLIAGTPVLISDQTPWLPSSDGALQTLPLGDPLLWASAIDRWAMFSHDERLTLRSAAYNYAKQYVKDSNVIERNRRLFLSALQGCLF